MAGRIVIVDYDPAWPAVFESLRARVADALGSLALGIEHVGGTAVPGLAAKPIIDLDVIVAHPFHIAEAIERLEEIGYRHRGDEGILGREAFDHPSQCPLHHLYVCAVGSLALRHHLALREVLRADCALAAEYAALKRALAARFGEDREAYAQAKSAFIDQIYMRCGLPPGPGR